MKKLFKFVVSCTFITCLSLFGEAGVLPVNAKAADICVGSGGISSIEDALEQAKEGDTIFVPAGQYKEQISVEVDGVTIEGEEGTILEGTGITPTEDDDSMICVSASDVTIKNIEIRGFVLKKASEDIAPKGIYIDEGSENVTIDHCKIHDMGCKYSRDDGEYNAHGILVDGGVKQGTKNIAITNCEVYGLHLGNSEAVVVNGNVEDFKISRNKIHDCDNIAIDAIGYEESEKDDRDRARSGEISDNVIYNITSTNNVTYEDACAGGIYIDGGTDIDVNNNYVENCDIGIEIATEHKGKVVDDIRVYDNTLVNNNNQAGISLGGYDPDDTGAATNVVITNNTICNSKGTCFQVQYACDSSNKFQHNLVIATERAKAYSEECGSKSRGNDISSNVANAELTGTVGKIKVKKVSSDRSSGTVTIVTSNDTKGYGSTDTVLENN
ncbi:MAG: right-handed parallel beta-helix repeat-containing protein [Butyrivibrio sp.]|nr:right-handed parallel beta-helix repeat-containing protein [Butyrivibrio sp.]